MIENIDKIEKIFKMMGSEHDHEALAAIRAIKSILKGQQKNYSDLANHLFGSASAHPYATYTPPRYREKPKKEEKRRPDKKYTGMGDLDVHTEMCEWLLENADGIGEWDEKFVDSVYNTFLCEGRDLSEKQTAMLEKIFRRYHG